MKPTYEELEAKCAALGAENAALKLKGSEMLSEAAVVYNKHNELIHEPWGAMVDHQTLAEFGAVLEETPATDAFLAEVRAQGVEMFAEMYACEAIKDGDVEGWKSNVSNAASEYAAQLRQEAAQ